MAKRKSVEAEEVILTEDGREATIAAEPATTFEERTVTQSQVQISAEEE